MNKLFYTGVMAIFLALSSCSQEEVDLSSGEEGKYSFHITLPETYNTRSIGDGTAAESLAVLVYDAEDSSYLFTYEGNTNFGEEGTATVDLDFVTGKSYDIIFFATSTQALQGTNPVYSIDTQTGVLSVNYATMTSEGNLADAYDCFYSVYSTGKVTAGSTSISLQLKRPVAQINWATDDLGEPEVIEEFGTDGEYILTTLTVTPYESMNLLKGEIESASETVTLQPFAIPKGALFPEEDYTLIATQYLLAPIGSPATMDMTLKISNGGAPSGTQAASKEIVIHSAQVQANYQTNITGSLLSSTENN